MLNVCYQCRRTIIQERGGVVIGESNLSQADYTLTCHKEIKSGIWPGCAKNDTDALMPLLTWAAQYNIFSACQEVGLNKGLFFQFILQSQHLHGLSVPFGA